MGNVYAFGVDFNFFIKNYILIKNINLKSISPEKFNTSIMKKNATIYKQNFVIFPIFLTKDEYIMHCDVYKFPKNEGWYAYIARPNYPDDVSELKDWLGVLPTELRAKLGLGAFVMHLDLATRDKLAQADIKTVKAKLAEQGYYLQAPPSEVLMQQALNNTKTAQDKKWD